MRWTRVLAMLLVPLCTSAGGCTADSAPRVVTASMGRSRIVYSTRGRGEPALVFVHGWSCSKEFWDAQFQGSDLAAHRRMIAVDLVGHGASDKPNVKYTVDLFARSVLAAMDDAGVRKAVFVGHSNGVPVVRQLHRNSPERTAGLVLVDGPLRPFYPPGQMNEVIDPLRGPKGREGAARMVDSMLGRVVDAQRRAFIRERMLATPQHVMIGALEAVNDPAVWTEDPINVPVLVVQARSRVWDDDYEAFVRRIAPEVEYRVMDGVSHFLMMDKPQQFNALLLAWLRKHGW